MSIVQWPTQLPNPTISGYSINPREAVLRTEMSSGPARQRRRFTQVPTVASVRWLMTDAQFSIFEAWYKSAIYADEGGAWFEIKLYAGTNEIQESRFLGPYQANLLTSALWEIIAELEINNNSTISTHIIYKNRHIVYYTTSSKSASYSQSEITGGSSSYILKKLNVDFTFTPGGKYILFAYPNSLGEAYFTINLLKGGFNLVQTINIINSAGSSDLYRIYRSTLPLSMSEANVAVRSTIYDRYNNIYYGASEYQYGYDQTSFSALESRPVLTQVTTFSANANSMEYILYAYPKRFGTSVFQFGEWVGGFTGPYTVLNFMNEIGVSEDYYIYRSVNHSLGYTTIKVS